MNDKEKAKRKIVPNKIRALLQRDINSKCPFCFSEDVDHFEVHHIDGVNNNNAIDNLILLCPTCHSKIEKGDLLTAKVKITKSSLKTKHELTAIELAAIDNQEAIIARNRLNYLNSNEAKDDLLDEKNKFFQILQNKCDNIIKETSNFGLKYTTAPGGHFNIYFGHIYISVQFNQNPFLIYSDEQDEYHIACTFNEREGIRNINPQYKFEIYRYLFDINDLKVHGWSINGNFKTSGEVAEDLLSDLIKISKNY